MNAKQQRKTVVLERIDKYLKDHPLVPEIPRVTTLTTTVTELLAAMREDGGDQEAGFGQSRGGVSERKMVATELREMLAEMGRTARALDPVLFPGLAAQMVPPTSQRSFQGLQNVARAYAQAVSVAAVKAAFVERAYPATFDTELTAKIAEFETASEHKYGGILGRRQGTVALDLTVRRITTTVGELDAILSKRLRKSDPTLYAVWKTARRTAKDPQHAQPATTTPTATPGSGGTPGAPTPASSPTVTP